MLRTVESYHCMQFQVKLMDQTWENIKKPSFGPEFDDVKDFEVCRLIWSRQIYKYLENETLSFFQTKNNTVKNSFLV